MWFSTCPSPYGTSLVQKSLPLYIMLLFQYWVFHLGAMDTAKISSFYQSGPVLGTFINCTILGWEMRTSIWCTLFFPLDFPPLSVFQTLSLVALPSLLPPYPLQRKSTTCTWGRTLLDPSSKVWSTGHRWWSKLVFPSQVLFYINTVYINKFFINTV